MPSEQDLMLAMASALVAVAYRACRATNCGVMDAISGTRNRPLRCEDCPLEDVDAVTDIVACRTEPAGA
jgi:hypothetical protein